MFRRSLPLWLVLTMVAGSSARAQSPFPRDLVPGRLPLERLGLERQWFAVVPLVETERLVRISRTQDLLFAQTTYARLHTFDAETGRLLWSADLGERSGFARGRGVQLLGRLRDQCQHALLPRSRQRPADLAEEPRDDPDEHARLRRVAGHGGDDQRADRGVPPQADSTPRGTSTSATQPIPLWSYHAGRPDHHASAAGREPRRLRRRATTRSGSCSPTSRRSCSGSRPAGPSARGSRAMGRGPCSSPPRTRSSTPWTCSRRGCFWTFATRAHPIAQEPLVADQEIFVINTAGDLSSLDPTIGAAAMDGLTRREVAWSPSRRRRSISGPTTSTCSSWIARPGGWWSTPASPISAPG